MAAVLEDMARLFFIEGDLVLFLEDLTAFLIGEAFDVGAADYRLFHDLRAVLRLHLDVEPALWFDTHQRPHLAEAVAAGLFQPDGMFVRLLFKFDCDIDTALRHDLFQLVIYLQGAARYTAGTGTDEDFFVFLAEAGGVNFAQFLKFFASLYHLRAPP